MRFSVVLLKPLSVVESDKRANKYVPMKMSFNDF